MIAQVLTENLRRGSSTPLRDSSPMPVGRSPDELGILMNQSATAPWWTGKRVGETMARVSPGTHHPLYNEDMSLDIWGSTGCNVGLGYYEDILVTASIWTRKLSIQTAIMVIWRKVDVVSFCSRTYY